MVAESEALDRETDLVQTEIYETIRLLTRQTQRLRQKKKKLQSMSKNIEQHNDEFKEVLRSMDETSASSYLELLLSFGKLFRIFGPCGNHK